VFVLTDHACRRSQSPPKRKRPPLRAVVAAKIAWLTSSAASSEIAHRPTWPERTPFRRLVPRTRRRPRSPMLGRNQGLRPAILRPAQLRAHLVRRTRSLGRQIRRKEPMLSLLRAPTRERQLAGATSALLRCRRRPDRLRALAKPGDPRTSDPAVTQRLGVRAFASPSLFIGTNDCALNRTGFKWADVPGSPILE